MTSLWLTVLGLAVVDSVNPFALAVTAYLLLGGTYSRWGRARHVLVYIAAVAATYFILGVLLMLGVTSASPALGDALSSPPSYAVQAVLGATMFAYSIFAPAPAPAARSRRRLPTSRNGVALLSMGVAISVVELPTALPFIAAVGVMTTAGITVAQWLPMLLVYVLVMVLPPVFLAATCLAAEDRLGPRLEKFRSRLSEGGGSTALLWVVGIVGFLLLRDALAYFEFFGLVDVPSGGLRER